MCVGGGGCAREGSWGWYGWGLQCAVYAVMLRVEPRDVSWMGRSAASVHHVHGSVAPCMGPLAGTKGVYIGIQDFWVDSIVGGVSLSVQHGQRVSVNVRGQTQSRAQHPFILVRLRDVSVRLRVEGFALKGEKGTKVPDLKVCVSDGVCVCRVHVCAACMPCVLLVWEVELGTLGCSACQLVVGRVVCGVCGWSSSVCMAGRVVCFFRTPGATTGPHCQAAL